MQEARLDRIGCASFGDVNIRLIKELRPLSRGEYVIALRDGAELSSSRRFRGELQVILDQ